MFYGFLLNMWVMKKADDEYLSLMVQLGRITALEKDMIMTTPQWENYNPGGLSVGATEVKDI